MYMNICRGESKNVKFNKTILDVKIKGDNASLNSKEYVFDRFTSLISINCEELNI